MSTRDGMDNIAAEVDAAITDMFGAMNNLKRKLRQYVALLFTIVSL